MTTAKARPTSARPTSPPTPTATPASDRSRSPPCQKANRSSQRPPPTPPITPPSSPSAGPPAPPNAAPTAADDSYTTNQNTALNVARPGVLTNDTDPEGTTLTALKVSNPANGTLTLNADGSLTYTPSQGFSGTDTFTYKANDGTADSNVATVTITVRDITAPTVSSVTPPEEQQGVSLSNPNISATFSEQMDPSTLNGTTFEVDQVKRSRRGDSVLENNVAASVNYDPNTRTATLTPNSSLVAASWYRVTVMTGAKDLAGNALGAEKVWYFKTARR